jgi:hypothetical protein
VEGHANRCVASPRGPRFSVVPAVSGGRAAILIEAGELEPTRREALGSGESVAALSCDDSGATALVRNRARAERILSCNIARGNCAEVRLPSNLRLSGTKLDVARIGRATVVAMTTAGVLRITTTRDEGASFTPPTLIFDSKDGSVPVLANGFVATLLPMANLLMVHLRAVGNAQAATPSPEGFALVSEDLGASFRSF